MAMRTYVISVVLLASLAVNRARGQCPLPVAVPSGPYALSSAGTRAAPRTIMARRAATPPVLDGLLDDPAWRTAPVATGFVQQRPTPGASATQHTEARVLYDDHAIYIAMRMDKSLPGPIAATIARRDYTGFSDWAQVMIDSHHDRRTAFRFAVNPAGVQKDALEYNDGNGEDVSWDAVWQAVTHVDSLGWTAEFRIPLSQLRFSGGHAGVDSASASAGQVWGVDFIRDVARLNERDYWAFIPPGGPGFVSCFGELTGLRDLTPPRRLEVLPYSLASVTRAPGSSANPFFERSDMRAKVGADFKYGLTSDVTLTGTVNPDFGQVEADPAVVNLTAFETFFPEKRPFFVEGSDLFRFDIGFPLSVPGANFGNDQPFYSRRVGRAPQGGVPGGTAYSDVPEATTILGAAKLSGKTSHGWSIGFLDAVTNRELGHYTDDVAGVHSIPVEPLTNYAVLRTSKDFQHGASAVGGIITATDRRLDGGALDGLRSAAYAAGVDGRHRFGGGNYEVTGSTLGTYLLGSHQAIANVQGAPGHYFQRPDASYIDFDTTRTSLAGAAASGEISKIGGGPWRWSVAGHVRSPGFDMNDMGFQQTADWLLGGAQLGYEDFQPGKHIRDWRLFVSGSSGWSFGGERRATGVSVSGGVDFLNNWGAQAGVTQTFDALSLDALRGGPALRTPAQTTSYVYVNSDARKRVNGAVEVDVGREPETGGHSLGLFPRLNVRAGGRAEVSVGPSVSWTNSPWQFITRQPALGDTHYIFGRIKQTTVSLTARASYSLTPNVSFEFYGEPFVSAGAYSEFKQVADPRAARFDARFHTFTTSELGYSASTRTYSADLNGDDTPDLAFANPDFNVKQFRSTAVMRWEYRPGSTLFVVWSQGRSLFTPTGTFDLRHNTNELFGADATNILLVKLNFWLSM